MIVPIAPLAAQTAPKKPITNATPDVPPLESLQVRDERNHALRRDRVEQLLDVVEQVEHAERADQERDGREECEQRAVGDLLREAHAVIAHERAEAPFQRRDPLAEAQPLGRARRTPYSCATVLSRGRQGGSARPGPSCRLRVRAGRSVARSRRPLLPEEIPRRARRWLPA